MATSPRATAVGGGNHDAIAPGLEPLYGWYPIDVLHFPIRSLEQFERKFIRHWRVTSGNGSAKASNPFYDIVREAQLEGRIAELYDSYVAAGERLARGLADGTFVEDTRLRDALRSLRQGTLELGESEVDTGYLTELGYVEDHTPFLRAQQRVDALETRLSRLESRMIGRVAKRLGVT